MLAEDTCFEDFHFDIQNEHLSVKKAILTEAFSLQRHIIYRIQQDGRESFSENYLSLLQRIENPTKITLVHRRGYPSEKGSCFFLLSSWVLYFKINFKEKENCFHCLEMFLDEKYVHHFIEKYLIKKI